MKVIGLTGGIATGKSTIANIFVEQGVAVFDADKYVHHLLDTDNDLIAAIVKEFPQADASGRIDRKQLGRTVFADDKKLKQLETMIHPYVRQGELDFLFEQEGAGVSAALLDIPLLFETDAHTLCDVIVVTDCSDDTQRARVLARPNMTHDKLDGILARQMKRDERNAKADFVISTDQSIEACRAQVKEIISTL